MFVEQAAQSDWLAQPETLCFRRKLVHDLLPLGVVTAFVSEDRLGRNAAV